MKRSAGLAIFADGRRRILLVHPTSAPWWGTWSIPKGLVDPGESPLAAAVRETREETGLLIDPATVDPEPHEIPYRDRRGRVTKRVVWFACDVEGLPERLPAEGLQRKEVDHAEFLAADAAARRILPRLAPILELLRG